MTDFGREVPIRTVSRAKARPGRRRRSAKHFLSGVEGDTKYEQDCECETRNPKFETISNDQNKSNSKRDSFEFDVLDFPDFSFIGQRLFRISIFNFGFLSAGRDKFVELVLLNTET
jgi:hypothetical protein